MLCFLSFYNAMFSNIKIFDTSIMVYCPLFLQILSVMAEGISVNLLNHRVDANDLGQVKTEKPISGFHV